MIALFAFFSCFLSLSARAGYPGLDRPAPAPAPGGIAEPTLPDPDSEPYGPLLSLEPFFHATFRDNGTSAGPGGAIRPRIKLLRGTLRPGFAALVARDDDPYPILLADLVYEDPTESPLSPFFGVIAALSLERAVSTRSLAIGPTVGASLRAFGPLHAFARYSVFIARDIVNQLQLGGGVSF